MQKYLFIPLDIFRENKHNVDIREKRDAWLTLFSSDDPDMIIELIEEYPEFRQIYEEAYEICLNMEKVMDIFSKELYELDKNTAQYMIDELQETIDKQKQEIDEMQEEHIKAIDEMQKEYSKKIDVMQETHIKEMDEKLKQGIRNTLKILRDFKLPEQDIRARICEQYQISEEQVREFLD